MTCIFQGYCTQMSSHEKGFYSMCESLRSACYFAQSDQSLFCFYLEILASIKSDKYSCKGLPEYLWYMCMHMEWPPLQNTFSYHRYKANPYTFIIYASISVI